MDHHPIGHIWFEHDHNRVLLQIRVIDLGISTLRFAIFLVKRLILLILPQASSAQAPQILGNSITPTPIEAFNATLSHRHLDITEISSSNQITGVV